jgi:uncharacterized phosphatase
MIIALVRHGETDWNRQRRWQGRSGVALNETGRRQALAAAPLLIDRRWSWMITSPLPRARQTGELISTGLPELPIDSDRELVERDYGVADGMLAVEAAAAWPDGNFPGMESDQELRRRGAAALRRIAAGRADDGIVVAHGAFIRATITELCGYDAPRIINGSVSLLAVQGNDWSAVEINRTGQVEAMLDGATGG